MQLKNYENKNTQISGNPDLAHFAALSAERMNSARFWSRAGPAPMYLRQRG